MSEILSKILGTHCTVTMFATHWLCRSPLFLFLSGTSSGVPRRQAAVAYMSSEATPAAEKVEVATPMMEDEVLATHCTAQRFSCCAMFRISSVRFEMNVNPFIVLGHAPFRAWCVYSMCVFKQLRQKDHPSSQDIYHSLWCEFFQLDFLESYGARDTKICVVWNILST